MERWIVARLRHQTFFALAAVNTALTALRAELNTRSFKKLPGSRQQLFESLDRPALRPLPGQPYEYAEWKQARVNIDYHVEVEGHYYSVPYALIKQQLDVRLSAHVVELFHKGLGACSYKSIESMLKHGLDRRPVPEQRQTTPLPRHDNIRGPQYYSEERGEP